MFNNIQNECMIVLPVPRVTQSSSYRAFGGNPGRLGVCWTQSDSGKVWVDVYFENQHTERHGASFSQTHSFPDTVERIPT